MVELETLVIYIQTPVRSVLLLSPTPLPYANYSSCGSNHVMPLEICPSAGSYSFEG